MPNMWFSKDGRRPHSQSGSAMRLTSNETAALLKGAHLMFVGPKPPSINSDTPSDALRNVVLELEVDEKAFEQMPVPGYYLAVGVRAEEIQHQLRGLGKNYLR